MGLSEAEITVRLAALRRRRELLDREIADLVLYQELGRRLGAAGAPPDPDGEDGFPDTGRGAVGSVMQGEGRRRDAADAPAPPRPVTGAPVVRGPAVAEQPVAIPPVVAFAEDAAGARRYGRAVVEAACAVIAAAGRPLHAAAILDDLLKRGFTLPGRDPVAALNTRLWKRAGPDGPLRRVGEATYALAAASDPDPV